MDLRQLAGLGHSPSSAKGKYPPPEFDRSLTLLVEGMALHISEIDAPSYKEFRENITRLALRIQDRLPEDDRLELIQNIIR